MAEEIARGFGRMDGVVSWLTSAIAASILGLIIGGIVVVIVRQFTKHPEEYIVD
jgi:predicted DNA repair protein MutK